MTHTLNQHPTLSKPKVAIYARVSSIEQVGGYSIDAQVEQCRDWAVKNGYEVVNVYIEPGKSAKTDQRPVFQSTIRFVLARAADAVLVHRADRFARNLFAVWADLAHDEERQELLNLIFLQQGVRVAAGGSISEVNLKIGFVRMN